jgi:hypothetical protein
VAFYSRKDKVKLIKLKTISVQNLVRLLITILTKHMELGEPNYPDLELICNQKTAIESELDFYFPQLRFAIELNGITHYEPIYGADKFEKIQNNDKRKVIACYEKGIELTIVDTSSCSYLSANNKEKYKNLIFGLLDQVKNRV